MVVAWPPSDEGGSLGLGRRPHETGDGVSPEGLDRPSPCHTPEQGWAGQSRQDGCGQGGEERALPHRKEALPYLRPQRDSSRMCVWRPGLSPKRALQSAGAACGELDCPRPISIHCPNAVDGNSLLWAPQPGGRAGRAPKGQPLEDLYGRLSTRAACLQ